MSTKPSTKSMSKIDWSVELAARELRNANGQVLTSVVYDHGQMDVHIAGGAPVPAWLLDRIDRIAKKYGEYVFQWHAYVPKEKEEDKPRPHRPSVRETWTQLNGVLEVPIFQFNIKPDANGDADVRYMIDGKLVTWFDMHSQPELYAKRGREMASNARCVKKLALELTELIMRAVARREQLPLDVQRLVVHKWGKRALLTVRLADLGKENLRLPTEKQAAKAAKTPRVKHTQPVMVSAEEL